MRRKQEPKKRLHDCDYPGCKEAGEYRAPKDRTLRSHYWFCLKHVQEYNKKWDFLAGLSADQIEEQIQNDVRWQRPTWNLNATATYAKPKASDRFRLFDESRLGMTGHYNPPSEAPKHDKKVTEAAAFMELQFPFDLDKLKKQYKMLAKRYHPDLAKGNSEAFQHLTNAYTTLVAYLEQNP